jgi:hypothetical protein
MCICIYSYRQAVTDALDGRNGVCADTQMDLLTQELQTVCMYVYVYGCMYVWCLCGCASGSSYVLYVWMYVCMWVYGRMCVRVCMYAAMVFVRIRKWIFSRKNSRLYVCMYVCVCMDLHACMDVCMYGIRADDQMGFFSHARTPDCMYVCVCMCVYVYMYTARAHTKIDLLAKT